MERILLVDGSNLLFQMFFGMPSRIVNKDGKLICGTLGFVGALLKMIRRVEPTGVAVFFDGEHENVRTAIDSDYKANRTDFTDVPEEDNPFSQLPDIYRALEFMGIRFAETTDCETDDLMAGYALRYADREIVISSFDSDFFQLITDKVSVLRYRGDSTTVCTPIYIKEKFGIEPCQYADFKALVGDTSDNIKGAEKVGPKTAAGLLSVYGDLDCVLKNAENIEKPSVRASILACRERLRRNYRLIKLTGDARLPFLPEELSYTYDGSTTAEVMRGIGIW